MILNTRMYLSKGLCTCLVTAKSDHIILSLSKTVSLAIRTRDRGGSGSTVCQLNDAQYSCRPAWRDRPFQASHPHPQPRLHSSASTLWLQSLQIQTGGDGELDSLVIAFLGRTRCKKDLLYLFEIANSHGQ